MEIFVSTPDSRAALSSLQLNTQHRIITPGQHLDTIQDHLQCTSDNETEYECKGS